MQSCVFCNAPLQPGQTFCGSCGQMQPQASADLQTTIPTGEAPPPPPAPVSGPATPVPNAPASGPSMPPVDLYAQTMRSSNSMPGVSDSSLATQADAPGLPPPPPPGAPGVPLYAPPPVESWGPAQPGAPGVPSGAWPQTPGGPASVPVAPGWQPTGSQPWQQPTVGWQPTGSQPWQGPPVMPPPGAPGSQPWPPATGSQPWQQAPGSQPWQGPPVMPPPGMVGMGAPGAAGRKTNNKKIMVIVGGVLAGVILLVAAFGLLYALTRPNPSITVTSATTSGSLPSGSPDKVFHIQGQKFSGNEAITLLLDGKAAPGASDVSSDSSGAFSLDLTITDDWLVGKHQLTAHDTSGYVTKTPADVQIVAAPVIDVASEYQSGSTPAGAAGTSFHITGKRFPLNSSITFLLDDRPIPGGSSAQSDDHGKIDTQFSVTGDWALGDHAITAQDAQGDSTQQSAPVVIVNPGEAGTPGPNGAPADDASFSVSVSGSGTTTAGDTFTFTNTLQVTGQADPAGGTVCGVDDDGQPHTYNKTLLSNGEAYTETYTFSCTGSYKSGHLIYSEIVTSDTITLSGGGTCSTSQQYVIQHLDGTFTSSGSISGTSSSSYAQLPCNARYAYIYYDASAGSWTGGQY